MHGFNTDPIQTRHPDLGPKPKDPSLISFAPECFVPGPPREEWVIVKGAPGYPERFTNEAEALARGRVLGRTPHKTTKPTTVRVRWF